MNAVDGVDAVGRDGGRLGGWDDPHQGGGHRYDSDDHAQRMEAYCCHSGVRSSLRRRHGREATSNAVAADEVRREAACDRSL